MLRGLGEGVRVTALLHGTILNQQLCLSETLSGMRERWKDGQSEGGREAVIIISLSLSQRRGHSILDPLFLFVPFLCSCLLPLRSPVCGTTGKGREGLDDSNSPGETRAGKCKSLLLSSSTAPGERRYRRPGGGEAGGKEGIWGWIGKGGSGGLSPGPARRAGAESWDCIQRAENQTALPVLHQQTIPGHAPFPFAVFCPSTPD
ncbi:unnamed protein product [Pleuronectes platessa]|uniref:Uncharacterized protein n=1 Tax=Pleuronectes platessa TaxID=8262 RepID=A0A9N7V5L3_PLEPL|nr:unnamed protein product [Pleuronectes platessa]